MQPAEITAGFFYGTVVVKLDVEDENSEIMQCGRLH